MKIMKPLVSVVIPVYKVEAYIAKTLEAIVNQTYPNIELILVDDGTPDNSIAVAEAYLKGWDKEWSVLRQPNSGLPTARNNGIAAAKGMTIEDIFAERSPYYEKYADLRIECTGLHIEEITEIIADKTSER